MAYLGNQPVIGDSTNTFKLLDDISTFTLTFDGSSASVVSVANDTLTFANHRFVTGQRVTYTDGGGTVITGLTDGTAYFIIKVDQNTIKLATSASNATSSTAIDLTGVGAGTSHTLNVAFDGVNTKFKATHTNGKKAGVSRAAQLSLSINGVIQQPTETKPPTVGYGIESDSTIVFSTAPVNTDKVFASFIGEVAASFDIIDNTVNNFTGDGSTASFNLSKEIPSNNDVLVTLDGVTQHPSDTSTTRSYSVTGQTLTFTTAPADGVAIQARLIGFAGATTSAVTGFYGRTGNVALKNTDDITFQNANVGVITASRFVGVVTATDVFVSGIATFAGDVSIGGTLTYEDVTNIDSVGIITARSNIVVGTGITLSPDGDVFATGISTFSEGFAGDVIIDDKIVHRGDTNTAIRFPAADTITSETGGSERLRITSDGRLLIGIQAARNVAGGTNDLLQVESSGGGAGISVVRNSDSTFGPTLDLGKSRGYPNTIVQDDDKLGVISFAGADGTDMASIGAQISGEVDGTPGENDMPGRIVFKTTADGASSTTERLRITSAGRVGIGENSPEGHLHISSGTSGDCVLIIEADTDDNNENDNPKIIFKQDGGSEQAAIEQLNNELTLSNSVSSNGGIVFKTGSASGYTNATESLRIDPNGEIQAKGGVLTLEKQGASNYIEVGKGQNANNYAYVDLIGDTTYTNYGLRMLRGNTGANANSEIFHRGTGILDIKTKEAGDIKFSTDDEERLRITSDGKFGFGTDSPSNTIHMLAGGGETVIELQRNSNNTTGNVGAINFTASDGHSVASIGAYGGGDNESAYINFKTTTAASANSPFTTTTERMRIAADGYVSGNINVPAWFGQQDTAHNVDTATWTTIVNLGNSVVNPSMNNGGWDESAGTFTVQSGQAGTYYVFGQAGIDDIQGDDIVRVGISKNNGTPNFFGECRAFAGEANEIYQATIAMVITVSVGDTIRLKVYHNEGTSEVTEQNRCYFGGYRIAT